MLERIAVLLFGLFTFIILIKYLDKDEFGVWVLFLSITTIVDLIRNGFIKSPMILHRSPTDAAQTRTVETASFALNIIITFLILLVLLSLSHPLSVVWKAPQIQPLLLVYVITSVFMIFFSHFEFIQQANMNFRATFYSYAVQRGLFFLALLAGFRFYKITLIEVAYIQAVTVLASAFFAYVLAKKHLHWEKKIDRFWIRKLFDYGKYTLGTNISSIIMRNIDSWMLGMLMSPVAVAIYNPAVRVANLLEVPTTSIASVMFPKAVERIKNEGKGAAKELYEKSVSLIFACMVPAVLFVIIFAKPIVILIAGTEYLDAVPVLKITMLYGLILPFNRQLGVILDAMGKAKTNMWFVARNALINIVLNYFMIQYFGVIGAAYATLLTFTISLIINQVYIEKNLNVKAVSYIKYTLSFYKKAIRFGLARFK